MKKMNKLDTINDTLIVSFYLNKVIKMTKNVRKPEAWNTKETQAGKF